MKKYLIEIDTDNMEVIKKIKKGWENGLLIVPFGLIKITEFDYSEEKKE
jgi:hypothetical protein